MRNHRLLLTLLFSLTAATSGLLSCAAPKRPPTPALVGLEDARRPGSRDSDPVDVLLQRVASAADPAERVPALRRLARSGDPRGVDVLARLLAPGSRPAVPPEVRRAALEGLATIGEARAIAALRQAAEDPAPDLRSAATEALRQLCPGPDQARHPVVLHVAEAKGALSDFAHRAAELALRGILRARRDLALTAPGCPADPPPPRPRRRSRREAGPTRYRVEVSVTVKDTRPESTCRVTVLVSTEPGGALKGRFGAQARIDGAASRLRIRQSIAGILASLQGELDRAFAD